MLKLHSIVPLFFVCYTAHAATQEPVPRDSPAAETEPQSALRGVLLLRGLFERFASENGGIAVSGAFARGVETPEAVPTLVVHEIDAAYKVGKDGKKGAIQAKFDLEIRARSVLDAVRLHESLRAFLGADGAVVSDYLVSLEDADDGRGVRAFGCEVLIDASDVEIERSYAQSAAGRNPLELIRRCVNADHVELGPVDIEPRARALGSGKEMHSYRVTSRARGEPHDLMRITSFAKVFERSTSDYFVTHWKLERAKDDGAGPAGWVLDVTVSRIGAALGATAKLEPQSALQAMHLLQGYFQDYVETGGLTLDGVFVDTLPGPPSGHMLVVRGLRATQLASKDGSKVQIELDLEIEAGDTLESRKSYEELRVFLGRQKEVESQGLPTVRELDSCEGLAIASYEIVIDASRIGIDRPVRVPHGDLEHFALCGRDARVGRVDIRPSKESLGAGRFMQNYKIVPSTRASASLELERVVAFADAIESGSPDFHVTELTLTPTVDEQTQREGWTFALTASWLR